jgi:hypothetical protein
MGNHPKKDIMVSSPNGIDFSIDVKGLYKRNFWAPKKVEISTNLFYVFAFVPDEGSNRFFVLTQTEVNEGIDQVHAASAANAKRRGAADTWEQKFPGVAWAYAEQFENCWRKLPA